MLFPLRKCSIFINFLNKSLFRSKAKQRNKKCIILFIQGSWELYLYCLYLIEPDHLPNEDYNIPGTGLIVSHENGNLFKMVPGEDFEGKLNLKNKVWNKEAGCV